MDIFIINKSNANNINIELLEEYRYKHISNPEKLKEHCFAYFMLHRILKATYNIDKEEIEFVNNKPYLKNRHIYFSISHSGNYITIGFSQHDCGIDIEKIKQRDFTKIAKRMHFTCATLEEFYKEWTKFEAEYKLGCKSKRIGYNIYDGHMIAFASTNFNESFIIYIQNGEKFSNL